MGLGCACFLGHRMEWYFYLYVKGKLFPMIEAGFA